MKILDPLSKRILAIAFSISLLFLSASLFIVSITPATAYPGFEDLDVHDRIKAVKLTNNSIAVIQERMKNPGFSVYVVDIVQNSIVEIGNMD